MQTSEFGSIIESVADGTIPATSWGTSVTPGTSNAYGSYTSILSGASLTSDAYGLEIIVSSAANVTTDRGMLVTVGFDPAGGTSFGGLGGVTGNEISHLLCSGAPPWYAATGIGSGGTRFYFPVFVKSGTSVGAKAQTNEATARTIRVAVRCYCKPSRRSAIRVGSFVRTFGATTASTDGTTVTQGTAAEGAWTSIGTAADKLWYLETGVGARTAAAGNDASHTDIGIGDASNKRVVISNIYGISNTAEAFSKIGPSSAYVNIAANDIIYARSQASVAQPGFSVACYGVGG